MAIIDLIEKLINEHGSAAILRERLLFLKDQCVALENELLVCRNDIASTMKKVSELESENHNLKLENSALKEQLQYFHSSNPQNYSCENCGSNKLKRTGSRPHETHGILGVKEAKYTCNDCGAESFFIFDPMQKGT